MQAHIEESSDVILAFPMERARKVQPPTEVIVPAALRRRRCTVLPLRRGDAAKRAALLVKLRCLHVEIQALNAGENAQSAAMRNEDRQTRCAIATRLK
jgi:hypothetical protein